MPAETILTAFGETKSASQWLLDPRCQVKRTTLHKRLNNGASHESAIAEPVGQAGPRKKPANSHCNIGPLTNGGKGRHMVHARIVLEVPTRVTNSSSREPYVPPQMGPAPGTNRFVF